MKYIVQFVLVSVLVTFCYVSQALAQQTAPTSDQQIEAAVLAAPEALRDEARVYGYNAKGEWETLRKGTNELSCIADDPGKSNFHVACYFNGLKPLMKRGRELSGQGLSRKEVDKKRAEEIESGELKLPRNPMTLYSLTGEEGAYHYESGTLKKAQSLTVVYTPFGTQESTGMATAPAGPGAPWLMEPGTPWAHIMIPGKAVGEETEQE